MADWSELQDDLIGEIAKNICSVEDFVVFSCVCPSWKLAAVKENRVSDGQFPWLVLAEPQIEKLDEDESNPKPNPNPNWGRGFFNFNGNKRYDLDVPNLGDCKVFGSNHGWIFTFNTNLELHLINPLSGLKLSLPSFTTLKQLPTDPGPSDSQWYRCCFIYKAIIVLKKNNQLLVAIIYGEFKYLAIAQPGDVSWIDVEYESKRAPFVEDVASYNGRLFGVSEDGALLLVQLDGPKLPELIQLSSPPIESVDNRGFYKMYLVESMASLLFVSRRIQEYPKQEVSYKTLSFELYKFDFDNNKWMKLDNLGDSALFVGDSTSTSLSSVKVSICERNSIYFTDDSMIHWQCSLQYGGHDIGVYSLEEDDIHPLPHISTLSRHAIHSAVSCPVWMVPSLF